MQEHFKNVTATMPLASMETRRMVAENTRKIIEQAFASGEPYANFEILDIFCQIMLDESVEISAGYIMNLLINIEKM